MFAEIISLLFIIQPSTTYIYLLLLQILSLFLFVLLALLKIGHQFIFELAVGRTQLFLHLRTTSVPA